MQADVDTEIDAVILRVPPTGIDDLVCVRGGIDGAVGDAIIHAIVTIVVDPVTKAVGPVSARARVAYARLGRRRARRRWRGTILAGSLAGVCEDDIVLGVIRGGMVEDGFLRGAAGIGRVEEGLDRRLQRERTLRRGAAHTEENAAEQQGCQCILE